MSSETTSTYDFSGHRYSHRLKNVLAVANGQARNYGHACVCTDHILLALIIDGHGIGIEVLKGLGCNLEDIRLEIEQIIRVANHVDDEDSGIAQIPFTRQAARLLQAAEEERESLGHKEISTEHVLLALGHSTNDTLVSQIFANRKIDLNMLRAKVIELVGGPGSGKIAHRRKRGQKREIAFMPTARVED